MNGPLFPEWASPIPLLGSGDRAKAPRVDWKRFQTVRASARQIEKWLREGVTWWGVVCGPVSEGLFVLDFDVPGRHAEGFTPPEGPPEGFVRWRELVEAHAPGLFGRLTVARTLNGGTHVYARAAVPVKCGTLARTAEGTALIETKGEGGYVVCPPTPGYRFVQGDLDSVPVIDAEEVEVLLAAARMLDAYEPPAPQRTRAERGAAGWERRSDPVQQDRARFEDALELRGWERTRHGGGLPEGVLWVRPGKTLREGPGAQLFRSHSGDVLFYVHTTNAPPLEGGKTYDFVGLIAAYDHGGDRRSAWMALCGRTRADSGGTDPAAATDPGRMARAAILPVPEPDETPVLEMTDVERASAWVDAACRTLRYVPALGKWIERDPTGIWDVIDPDVALRRCGEWHQEQVAIELERIGADAADKERRRVAKLAALGTVKAAMGLALGIPKIREDAEVLDADPLVLGTLDGPLHIKERRLLGSGEGGIVTRRAPVRWDPSAECPEFWRFLRSTYAKDEGLIRHVLKLLALSITGDMRHHVFIMLIGDRGRNGKTVLLNIMKRLLGPYAHAADAALFVRTHRGDKPRFSSSQLEGIRFACVSEAGGNVELETEFVKLVSGGDQINAERKGQDGRSFLSHTKLWIAANSIPSARLDPSLMARVHPIPHEVSFYNRGDPEYRPGDQPPDLDLPRKLGEELPGILRLLVEAYGWIEDEGIARPEAVEALKRRFNDENDPIGDWIAECCEIGAGYKTRVGHAFESYRAWAKPKGIGGTERGFSQYFKAKRCQGVERTQGGKNQKWLDGLRVLAPVAADLGEGAAGG